MCAGVPPWMSDVANAAVAWRWPYIADVRAGCRKKPDFSLYGGLMRLQPGVLPIRLLLLALLLFAAAAACFEWLGATTSICVGSTIL